jgi:hypothetical protein
MTPRRIGGGSFRIGGGPVRGAKTEQLLSPAERQALANRQRWEEERRREREQRQAAAREHPEEEDER